jgi:chromosome segregation ATPase
MAGADELGPGVRGPHFDIVIRGYNTRQVNERVTRLEFDLRNCVRDRDELRTAATGLQARLTAAEAELVTMREHVRKLANAPVTGAEVNERVQLIMHLVQEEITDRRRAADQEAADQRAAHERATAELQQRRVQLERKYSEHNDALDHDYDQLKANLTREHEQLMARARAEASKLTRLAEERAVLTVREAEDTARRRTVAVDEHTARMRNLHNEFRDRLVTAHATAQQAVATLTEMADHGPDDLHG